MSGWITASSAIPGGWITIPSDAWSNQKPKHPNINIPARAVIYPKRTDTMLLEEGLPTKRRKKMTLLDYFSMDIIYGIDIWLVVLEHIENLRMS